MHFLVLLLVSTSFVIITGIYITVIILREGIPHNRAHSETCHLAVFLGSGGHSSEALSLMSALDFSRYTPRTYFVSEGDPLSEQKAVALERLKAASTCPEAPIGGYQVLTLPRAREVHQNILTVPFTAFRSLMAAVYHVTLSPWLHDSTSSFDVLLLNGPGTCVILCLASYVNRLLGLSSPRLVYVETFARVRTLSLTGKCVVALLTLST
ncbi:oligosaccharide biosynthesis protein Alg14 like-domain-containing protein [Multifurca ochricompacta]|uniref:UDP-N-acetylglucosamine transferase subunit ALG14 n=1 Tax=Multifurca ochricompacta TaxID=376703 RepID=A0AAD4M4C8_9AGAM|nr:oligosaccharide biosynthesis protein Alg14 like-domain-containing protein [Multifurca ochricompacta]